MTIQDLKILNYIDVMKIFLSIEDKKSNQPNVRKATQSDIDKLLM